MSREREELLALVRHAEDPTQADEERVLRALQAAVATGGGARAPARPGSAEKLPAQPAALALKLSALGTVLTAAVAGLFLLRADLKRDASEVEPPPPPSARLASEAGSAPARSELPAPEAGPSVRSELPAPEAGPSARSEQAALEADAARSARQAALERDAARGAQQAQAGPDTPGAARAAEAAERSRTPSSARAARRAAARSASPAGERLRAEIALLERVQTALRRADGAAALRELDAHRTADRALLAERQAARILALCLVGELVEARRAAQAFVRQHPDSPQRAAIESSCANSRRIEEP